MSAASTRPSAPGTQPEGANNEREAAARVRRMFTQIVPRYDLLNHLLSFSLDRRWRQRTAREFVHILRRGNALILDLCCGTGDLTIALDRARTKSLRHGRETRRYILGCDFVPPMLVRAREKAVKRRRRVEFAAADALSLPFPDDTFDLLTTAFGFRNLANYERALQEFARVLKPKGEIGILEFSEPDSGLMAAAFRFYFRCILPFLGGVISGSREAYSYLPASVTKFPSPDALAAMIERAGFLNVRYMSWNFGSVILHIARRP